jgi:hypothetical protein
MQLSAQQKLAWQGFASMFVAFLMLPLLGIGGNGKEFFQKWVAVHMATPDEFYFWLQNRWPKLTVARIDVKETRWFF